MEMRVIAIEELEEILKFERELLKTKIANDFERELAEWSAPWRRESLEFYLPLGWSFSVREDGVLKGYLLAQPMLFYRGFTQTLWVEHLSYADDALRATLVDLAYRWARDKHFQRALFANSNWLDNLNLPAQQDFGQPPGELRTSKTS